MRTAMLFILAACAAFAQSPGQSVTIISTTTTPSGGCQNTQVRLKTPNGSLYSCQSGMWALVSGGGAPSGPAGGDLGGNYPNPTVLSLAHLATGLAACTVSATSGTINLNGNGTGCGIVAPAQTFIVGPLTGTSTITLSNLISGPFEVDITNGASAQTLTLPAAFGSVPPIPPAASCVLTLRGMWSGTAITGANAVVTGCPGYGALIAVQASGAAGVGFAWCGLDTTSLSYACVDSNAAVHVMPIVSMATAHQFVTNVTNTGATTKAPLGSGDVPCGALPALTGAVTSSAGSCATAAGTALSEVGAVDLTGQTAALTGQALFTPSATGFYTVLVTAKDTTPAGTSSVLGGTTGFVLNYTDGVDSVAVTPTILCQPQNGGVFNIGTGNPINTTLATVSCQQSFYAKTGVAVTFNWGYGSVGSPMMQYSIHVRVIGGGLN